MTGKRRQKQRSVYSSAEAIFEPFVMGAEQDEKFQRAMRAAIKRGLEHCATSVSTSFGTKIPNTHYVRDDLS